MAPPGLLRLNERTQRPNVCINFIKPLASALSTDQKIAKDFLERIAAQCYPVMKKNHIVVMSLEEHESNPEFAGRNFNAGECIQLVLKDRAGRWLSFKFVQMVMMHELAHCKQMNHSPRFWKVRHQYASEMQELWAKNYVGEGLWGRGQDLSSGAFMHERQHDPADLPEHHCGGAYRRLRGKKRKRGQDEAPKPKVTYAERQQRRIEKKFGDKGEGHGLGGDAMVRGGLEKRRSSAKPTQAQSKRGRELRANAALARFEAAKQQQQESTRTPETEDNDGSETDSDDDDDEFANGLRILDTLEKIKDQKGRDLYKVCGDDDELDEGAQQEMDDFRLLGPTSGPAQANGKSSSSRDTAKRNRPADLYEDSETESEAELSDQAASTRKPSSNSHVMLGKKPVQDQKSNNPSISKHGPEMERESNSKSSAKDWSTAEKTIQLKQQSVGTAKDHGVEQATSASAGTPQARPHLASSDWDFGTVKACPICSLENDPDSPTCLACSHVLKPLLMPNNWRCNSDVCKGSAYVNAGDVGRCGVCGTSKPASAIGPVRAMGVVGADVLRWD